MMDFGWFLGGGFLLMLLLGIAALALIVWAVVDLFSRPMDGVMRILWLLAILLFPFIGSLIYLIVGRNMRERAL